MRQSGAGALRRRLLILLVPLGVMLAVASPGASSSTEAAGGGAAVPECSAATAARLVEQNRLNGFGLPNPVRQVLCGSFMGPGSEAMAVTIGAPTCWPVQQWAIFGYVDGAWRLLERVPAYLVPPLTAVGNDIREVTAVHRSGDARCFPSGGTRARLWHWDGARFVAGPWQQLTKGRAAPRKSKVFRSPSGNIRCAMSDGGGATGANVSCWSVQAPQRVTLDAAGRLKTCRGRIPCLESGCGCIEGFDYPRLAYGRTIAFAPFRCASLQSGVRCVVTRTGRGFHISRAGLRRVG
jgi:hypothetical protein